METDAFFKRIETHYNAKLPFVVFSRSINTTIKCWLQKDDELRLTTDFSESGYVFSPFNLEKSSVVFLVEHSEQYSIDTTLDILSESTQLKTLSKASENYIQLIESAIAEMEHSKLMKVVLSRSEQIKRPKTNIFDIYKRLLRKYKNAMVYCWYHPKVGLWMGATPELLFKVEGSKLTTISLAGTRHSADTTSVGWTKKEIEEQQIVTDYISREIVPFAVSETISETDTVEAGHLLHLKTQISARLTSQYPKLEPIIKALHPTPAVCGFPKEYAKSFILKHEGYNREFYTGFLGEMNMKMRTERNRNHRNIEHNAYASYALHSHLYVNLRCMKIDEDKITIYVGGGITKASNPEAEWEETVNKSQVMRSVIY